MTDGACIMNKKEDVAVGDRRGNMTRCVRAAIEERERAALRRVSGTGLFRIGAW